MAHGEVVAVGLFCVSWVCGDSWKSCGNWGCDDSYRDVIAHGNLLRCHITWLSLGMWAHGYLLGYGGSWVYASWYVMAHRYLFRCCGSYAYLLGCCGSYLCPLGCFAHMGIP